MSDREPVSEFFDAVVDFFPLGAMPEMVYGLVKLTYDIDGDGLALCRPEPLALDNRPPDAEFPLAPGSDFWPMKMLTDVVVQGSAFGLEGKAVRSQIVRLTVGEKQKAIAVLGDRIVEWTKGRQPRFGEPEAFTEMPLVWSKAYGGFDPRVPVDVGQPTIASLGRLEFDHPGVYPRNPLGIGYVVVDDPADGVALPNLEDPHQMLRPETFVTKDPRHWYVQPLPACFEFTNLLMFPRFAWIGLTAWYPPPGGAQLREVELGELPPNFADLASVGPDLPLPPPALQEGPIGQVFPPLEPDTPICVEGMHPELPHVGFRLPHPPRIDFWIENEVFREEPQLTLVLFRPNDRKVSLTYVVRLFDLPRTFVPGLHANIPLALIVEADHVVRYVSPPTLRDVLQKAEKDREQGE